MKVYFNKTEVKLDETNMNYRKEIALPIFRDLSFSLANFDVTYPLTYINTTYAWSQAQDIKEG